MGDSFLPAPSFGGPAGTIVDPITQQSAQSAANSAVRTNSSPWGNAIPLSLGARAVTGKILWSSDMREIAQPESASGGATTTPHFMVDLAVSFGYSGAAPDKRSASQLIHLWANEIVCFDVNDPLRTQAFSGMTLRFHPGLIDALPDALIVADKGPMTPAWRNQIYVVIQNFPLWSVGLTDSLPDFVAEIFDFSTGEPSFQDYTLTAPITHVSVGDGFGEFQPIWYDYNQGVGYTAIQPVGGGDTQLSRLNLRIDALMEVGRATISGGFRLDTAVLGIHDNDNGLIITKTAGFANASPLHIVSLAQSKIMSSAGVLSGGLTDVLNDDPAQCTITYKQTGDVVKVKFLGSTWYGALLGGIFDQLAVVTYKKDGTGLNLTDAKLTGGDVGFSGPDNIADIVSYPLVDRTDLNATGIHAPAVPTYVQFGSEQSGLLPPFNLGRNQNGFSFLAHGGRVTLIRTIADFKKADPNAPIPLGLPGPLVSSLNFTVAEMVDVYSIPGAAIDNLLIDPNDHNLIVFWHPRDNGGGVTFMTKLHIQCTDQYFEQGWRPLVMGVLYETEIPHFFPSLMRFCQREFPPNAQFGIFGGDHVFYEIDLSNGTVKTSTPLLALDVSDGFVYDGRRSSLEHLDHAGDKVQHIKLRSTDASRMLLADVITAFMLSAGKTTDEFSIDPAINDTVLGAYVDQQAALWDTMTNLGTVFNFSYFTSGSLVKFVREALTEDGVALAVDLTTLKVGDSDPFESMTTQFASPDELPGNTGITYLDADQRYVANTQTYRRTNFPVVVADSSNDSTVSVPIVIKADEALRRSGQVTFKQFAKNEVFSFKLPAAYLTLEPVDVINVTVREFSYNILIGEMVFDTDWTLGVTGTNRNVRSNNAFRVGPDGNWIIPGTSPFIVDPVKPPEPPKATSPSDPVLLDIPLLAFSDSVGTDFASIMTGAASQVQTGWVGATVSTQVSTDPWQTFFHSTKSVPLASGNTLPPTSTPNQTDTSTVLRVAPINFDPALLTSVSDDDFRSGKNAMVIGGLGRWEVVYFRDAVVDGGMVNISTLVRGQRGTEGNCNNHTSADVIYFVTLAGVRSGIMALGVPFPSFGAAVQVRARGDSQRGDVSTLSANVDANSLKPFAPCDLKLTLGCTDSGSTSYTNECGNGAPGVSGFTYPSRTHLIHVSAVNLNTVAGADLKRLVDGKATTDTNETAVGWLDTTTNAVVTFDFRPSGFKQVIDELTVSTQFLHNSLGTYQIYGSNDQISWVLLKDSFNLEDSAHSFTNTDAYYFYRFLQTPGGVNSQWVHEFLFKVKAEFNVNDLRIRWLRRDRLGQEFVTTEVPMSEHDELYDLEILKDSAIVRTVTGLIYPMYTYTEAQQLADGFTVPQNQLTVRVYQQGTHLARGFVHEETIYTGA